MPSPDLVIFDCDGVLVDSEIIAARLEADLLTEAGIPITAAEIAEDYAGLTFKDIMLRLEEKAGVPLQASLLDRERAALDKRLAAEVRAIDGVREALISVTGPKCICSNSTPDRLEMMLTKTGLKPFFNGKVFSAKATESGRPKPEPDVFLHAARAMETDPEKAFVIEDSVHGVTAARRAGMRVIGFTGASHTYPGHADRLTEAGAETVIRRWAELKPVLAALVEWSDA
ncbi:MAG: HAD family hydrolase [Rhizobiaceae bacterium]|nr:HAD family hydrolase [Rhizobiaceae bacterium]